MQVSSAAADGHALSQHYRIGIDVGGTFADFVLERDGGVVGSHKELSSPADLTGTIARGLQALARLEGLPVGQLLTATQAIVHGTTVTTNALITGAGAPTGLVTTRGVRDALEMRRGLKEEVHNLKYVAPAPLVPRAWRVGVAGRLDHHGATIEPLDIASVLGAASRLRTEGVQAIAICFMHSYINPEHERAAAAAVAQAWPEAHVVTSVDVAPVIRFYERVSTTVISAYVGPLLSGYLDRLLATLSTLGFEGVLLIVNSAGGVMSPAVAAVNAAATVASGPSSGPVAATRFAREGGHADCVVVDMGGTSFDASIVTNGRPQVVHAGSVDRRAVALPMVAVESIGAGGGSIAWLDAGNVLRVGPRSAGASPGPACYGLGGEHPTVTDADVLLGYVDPDRFLGGRLRLDAAAAERSIRACLGELGRDPVRGAAGIFDIVNATMSAELRRVALARAHDVRSSPLVVAGGAGPLHAAAIGRELGIQEILVPRDSSTFCALGTLFLDYRQEFVRSCVGPALRRDAAETRGMFSELDAAGRRALASQGLADERMRLSYQADMRYERQLRELTVPVERSEALAGLLDGAVAAFHQRHEQQYGYAAPDLPVELVNLRVVAFGVLREPALFAPELTGLSADEAFLDTRPAYDPVTRDLRAMPLYDGARLGVGHIVPSPAIVILDTTSIVVSPPYVLSVDRLGTFKLSAANLEWHPSESSA